MAAQNLADVQYTGLSAVPHMNYDFGISFVKTIFIDIFDQIGVFGQHINHQQVQDISQIINPLLLGSNEVIKQENNIHDPLCNKKL